MALQQAQEHLNPMKIDPLHQIRPFVTLSQGVTSWESNAEHVQRYYPTL